MLYDIEDEDIVKEIRDLVKDIDGVKEKVDVYTDLVKQIFLSGSDKN
ncbi:hypothetical protein KBA27_00190 [bacterium]|nr:hypothetical protein [bacterium]